MSDDPTLGRALALLESCRAELGINPDVEDVGQGSWLQGAWGTLLAEAEQRSRAGAQHLPLRVLLAAARQMHQSARAAVAA